MTDPNEALRRLAEEIAASMPDGSFLPEDSGFDRDVARWEARLRSALPELSQVQGSRPRTICLQCGPNVVIDEDGCCAICGATATGPWLDYIRVYSDQPQPPARRPAEVETRGPVGRSTPPGELGPAPGPSGRG